MDIELQHWKTVSKNSKEPEERRRANAFIRSVEPIVQEITALETVRLREMEDSANSILGCLDDLWKLDDYHFPQDRMDRLLGISSTVFDSKFKKCFKSSPLNAIMCRWMFRRSNCQENQERFGLETKTGRGSTSLGSSMHIYFS